MWQLLDSIFADYELSTLCLIITAAFATAMFHAISGFAGGLLLSICLAPILGIKAVVPVVSVAMMISNSNRAWLFRQAIDWQVYRAIMITALPGFVIGALIYVHLPVAAIAILLGVFLLLSIPLRRVLKQRDFKVSLPGLSAAGAVFGVLAGAVIGAGLLLGPFLLGANVVGEGIVGMIAAIGFTSNITKSLVFGHTELLDPKLFTAGILVGLCTIPGAHVGRWVVRNTSIRLHTLLVETLIFCGALYFLYQGYAAASVS